MPETSIRDDSLVCGDHHNQIVYEWRAKCSLVCNGLSMPQVSYIVAYEWLGRLSSKPKPNAK